MSTSFSAAAEQIPEPAKALRAANALQAVMGKWGSNESLRGGDRFLPVASFARDLVPSQGLRRGAAFGIAKSGPGATSLFLAVLAAVSRQGARCAVVGFPELGLAAAAERGVAFDRLVFVPRPGPDWPATVAALFDGFDLVAVRPSGVVSAVLSRRLEARARTHRSVLLSYGAWPGVDLEWSAQLTRWRGLGAGQGRLKDCEITVSARGRGAAALARQTHLRFSAGREGIISEKSPLSADPISGTERVRLRAVG